MEHKVTQALPTDAFDKLLSQSIGLPGGAHTAPSTVQPVDFYGNVTTYVVQTVRNPDEQGVTAFVTMVNAAGSQRFTLPQVVLAVIDRQRESITTQLRRRHGRRIAEERKAAGIAPGFTKGKRRRKG